MNNFLVTLNRLLHIDIRYKCKEAIILNQEILLIELRTNHLLSCEWVSQICFKDQYTLWVHHTCPSNGNASSQPRGPVRVVSLSLSAPFQN